MPKTLKVFRYGDGKNELICGAFTKKEAAELFNISIREFNIYSSITGNPIQVKICTETPHQAFIRPSNNWQAEYKPVQKKEKGG